MINGRKLGNLFKIKGLTDSFVEPQLTETVIPPAKDGTLLSEQQQMGGPHGDAADFGLDDGSRDLADQLVEALEDADLSRLFRRRDLQSYRARIDGPQSIPVPSNIQIKLKE